MTVIPMPPIQKPSDVARDLTRSVTAIEQIVEAIAECLFLADSLQKEWYREEAWTWISAGSKAFYRERARMAIRLCDLHACDTARHRLACALERGIAAMLTHDKSRDALLELDREQISVESDAVVEELSAVGINAIWKTLKGEDAGQQADVLGRATSVVTRALEASTEISEADRIAPVDPRD